MIASKIYYEKNFAVGQFLFEKIGIELMPEPNETLDQLFDIASGLVLDQHKRLNPHLYERELTRIEPENTKPLYGRSLKEQLLSCTQLKVLESYKFIVKGKPEQEIYDQKFKELSENGK